jgi:molybdopterin molybdotransferase
VAPLLPIDDARKLILEQVSGRLGEETLAIDDALDRVLAQDVRAAGDVPAFPSAAMDGYAVGRAGGPATLRLVGESRAGSPYAGSLNSGEAIRISTGAAVPPAAEAVIRQEDVRAGNDQIETQITLGAGANIRWAGEDMRAGDMVLETGLRLQASELAAAVAAGAGTLSVARRPIVAVICTGDELRAPGEPLGAGEIHNSNGPMLRALATHCGAEAGPATRLADDAGATQAALARALEACDVLIISGGVSVGPHDHVKPALEKLGVRTHFWGVRLQPGKPTWFGSRGRRLVFALPGNPASAAVTFSLFARPALEALQGARPERELLTRARLAGAVRRKSGRDQAIRVRLETGEDGLLAHPTGAQDSHLLTSLVRADALAIIPLGDGPLPAGSEVRLLPLPR